MSASAIAAARLSKARRNDLAAAGEVALDSTEASRRGRQRLHTALLAHDSGAHALNPSAAFEPLLQGDGIVQPLSSAAARLFSSHVTFSLPSTDDSSIHDAVHKFTLAADRSAKLNDGLRKFALSKERKAVAARKVGVMQDQARNGQGALPHPKDRSLAGVLISNEGGFQSYPDLFDYADLLDQLPGAAARQTTTVVLNEWGRADERRLVLTSEAVYRCREDFNGHVIVCSRVPLVALCDLHRKGKGLFALSTGARDGRVNPLSPLYGVLSRGKAAVRSTRERTYAAAVLVGVDPVLAGAVLCDAIEAARRIHLGRELA